MKLVKSVLEGKGYDIWSVAPDAPVFDAIELMSDTGVGALLVLEAGRLVGIISERDYTRKIMLKGKSSRDTPVEAIMSAPVICTSVKQPIDECMALMTAKQIRHLPILEDDQLVGIVSLEDLVKAVISEQEELIRGLESYILYADSTPL